MLVALALLRTVALGEPSVDEAEAGAARVSQPSAGATEPSSDVPGATALPEPPASGEPTLPEPPGSDEPTLPEPPASGEPALPEPPASTERPRATEADALRWHAPDRCPSEAVFRRAVEHRLGRPLEPDELEADVQIEHTGATWTLRVQVGDERARGAETASCESLTQTAALMIALAVDPVAVAQLMEASAAVPIDEQPPPVVESQPRPASPSRPSGLEGGVLRAGAGIGLGPTPGVTGVFELAGGLRWRRARIELAAGYWIPRTSGTVDDSTMKVQLVTAAARGCGQVRHGNLEAPLCGGVVFGQMPTEGTRRSADVLTTEHGGSPWLALEASMGLSWWFSSRWALAGGFAALVPVVEPALTVGSNPAVRPFEPAAVAGRLWLGIELLLARRPKRF